MFLSVFKKIVQLKFQNLYRQRNLFCQFIMKQGKFDDLLWRIAEQLLYELFHMFMGYHGLLPFSYSEDIIYEFSTAVLPLY